MRILYQRSCGMDVHKDSVTVCLLIIEDDGELRTEKRQFGTMTRHLEEMASWLEKQEVQRIAIVYASHCTSFGRCETFSISKRLLDNLTPLASRGGLGPGSS